ncbi:Aim24p Ecym_4657 [Eremothecium cymbalariae DBVPG|uniref:Altered inheritance of mitochondria protein 24, mitochondrial n=1 Tax=Eremothecium cymbalariae (strain CBS 270.75 / DBVPG 7215 / KCTC 17166 / NRRL Y-17582) TaxID=931890 RepID=G8JSF7_ERECY|nr:hypothetical protein Ecym_4657 [Eremothecium cymbalariae DBVPG\
MSKVAKRLISLVRPGNTSIAPPTSNVITQDTAAKDLFPTDHTNNVQFEILDEPLTLARATVPPSVNLYVRRGCLMSLYNSLGLSSIAMSHQWIQPQKRLLRYGRLNISIYLKLTGADTLNCLVAPNFTRSNIFSWLGSSTSPYRTLCPLTLGGASDWFVFGKDSIVAFESNSSLKLQEAPFKLPFRTESVLNHKYQLLQGRGSVLLSGSGSVYKINLKDSTEEVIIQSQHLLAISGLNSVDISSSATEYKMTEQIMKKISKPKAKASAGSNTKKIKLENIDWYKLWINIQYYASVSSNFLKSLYTGYLNGPNRYLKVKGPRTLLVQSSPNAYLSATPQPALFYPKDSKYQTQSEALPSIKTSESKNYLSYVSMEKDGKLLFRSTPDFKETVEMIEKAKDKK